MKVLWGCILVAALLASHLKAQGEAPKRAFNTAQFTGLVTQEVTSYDGTVLDYELDLREGGTIRFRSCRQVESTREEGILDSQYSLFKLLSMNCLALKRYTASTVAQRSFFPAQLRKADIAAFPATAIVPVSEESLAQRQGRTLSGYEDRFDVSIIGPDSATVITSDDELKYHFMARADFDGDGTEDLLVRIDWRARNAMGRGTELILLSKKSADAPIALVWRS